MELLTDLLRVALKKRNSIITKINTFDLDRRKVEELWVSYEPKPKSDVLLCGIDGSMNYKEYKGFSLYAVTSSAVIFNEKIIEEIKESDVDVLNPYIRTTERVRLYMLTLETLIALKVCEKVDFILMDGSLMSNLLKSIPRNLRLTARLLKNHIINNFNSTTEIGVKGNTYDDQEFIYIQEFLKYLNCLKELIIKARDKIIAVAKTSQSTIYFRSIKPDIIVFQRLTRRSGYSKPYVYTLRDALRVFKNKKIEILINYLGNFYITTFYARLIDNGPVLKIEIPRKLNEDEIGNILDILSGYSVAGYPYPLRKAHMICDIKDKDMDCLVRLLGIYGESTGREYLEVL